MPGGFECLGPYLISQSPSSLTSLCHPTPEKKLSSTHLPPKPTTSSDPNKHIFSAYGNAAALFVQMGIYRGGPFAFAIVGLAQISAVNRDILACVGALSGDIPSY
ncbi:hypothetical protein MRB53_025427 [Persea americana]|uniref:Uncharacterized protein n=1 Tax=Persea americana TaxID=3435 RepID=A0ACC2LFU4_PERAE|nr:hypothetical protein MRB53_025427 [Persea americana]